jgi:ADP-heptose:LPS heptosyltransferase
MKNFFIKLLLLFRPKTTPHSNTNFFLIVSTTGLGDSLWATPAIRALRGAYPNAVMDVLTSPMGAQVLQSNPHINKIFIINSPICYSLLRLFLPLKKQKYDRIFLFHHSDRLILPFCAYLGAPIVGTAGLNKGLDWVLTHRLENRFKHEIVRRMEITSLHSEDQQLEFFTQQEVAETDRVVGLHPGAQNLFKQWPPESFILLGKKLQEKTGCAIAITGSAKEAALVSRIASAIPGARAYHTLSLDTLAALQKKMALLITNDTGPMHLAFAMGVPTIALFGPTDPALCGPHQAKSVCVLQTKKTCDPCLMKQCAEPFCLLQIGVDEVYQKALDLLACLKPPSSF